MTEYTCYDCTGRGGELVEFTLTVDGEEYEHGPTHCPICGQTHTVQTVEEYAKRHGGLDD